MLAQDIRRSMLNTDPKTPVVLPIDSQRENPNNHLYTNEIEGDVGLPVSQYYR